jgi:hypothetical protein
VGPSDKNLAFFAQRISRLNSSTYITNFIKIVIQKQSIITRDPISLVGEQFFYFHGFRPSERRFEFRQSYEYVCAATLFIYSAKSGN